MKIIWKLTISSFWLGIPKFSKINFTIAVDRNAVIKLHKSKKSNVEIAKRLDMNYSTVWKIVKKFQEIGKPLDRPRRGRKQSVCSPSTPRKHKGKAATKPSPKLQNLGLRSRCKQIHYAPGVERRSGGKALQDAASPGAYGQSGCYEGQKCREIV